MYIMDNHKRCPGSCGCRPNKTLTVEGKVKKRKKKKEKRKKRKKKTKKRKEKKVVFGEGKQYRIHYYFDTVKKNLSSLGKFPLGCKQHRVQKPETFT
eukprot:UN00412